ncbi:kinase-like protein [Lentinula edodes]|uniref:Kinase-like protein n=1 Tax=Lentinula edodes TaxID=5353 RepID=A0A1Q3EC15_LENED|nr:kinase-like protein [Lentinula edodes]
MVKGLSFLASLESLSSHVGVDATPESYVVRVVYISLRSAKPKRIYYKLRKSTAQRDQYSIRTNNLVRRRLRVDLAKKIARQAACALEHIHSAGFVHGDFTTSNLLFRLSHHAVEWSDDEVYLHLGDPVTDSKNVDW